MSLSASSLNPHDHRLSILHQAMHKALIESTNHFSKQDAIQEAYGEDAASIFGDAHILDKVLDGMLDKIHYQVKEHMQPKLKSLEERLNHVDTLIHTFQRQDQLDQSRETLDKESALVAIQQTPTLPDGMTAEMILEYKAYVVKQAEHKHLEQQLLQVQLDIRQLENQCRDQELIVEAQVQQLEQKCKELERTADICSIAS